MYQKTRFIAVLIGSFLAMGQAPMPGRADAGATVSIRAEFASQTSLRVSSAQVQFEIADPLNPPPAVIDFHACARTMRGAEVLLTVEPVGAIRSSERGPVAGDLTVAYQGEGGTSGTLSQAGAHLVGRWIGSGVRDGHVSFTLRGAQAAGAYSLPVKFVLSAP